MLTKPDIFVSIKDYGKLVDLLDSLPPDDATKQLLDELDRAEVIDSYGMADDVVAMHSTVSFTVLQTGQSFSYKLVYPNENLEGNKLSILSPVGSALLGLSVGQEMEWPFGSGKTTHLRIDAVSQETKETDLSNPLAKNTALP